MTKRMTPTQRKKARSATANRSRVKKVYGLTGEEQDAVLAAQGRLCAICKGKRPYRLCWDHNHFSGEVRGALCKRCNKVLRDVRDDVYLLYAAAEYLLNPPVSVALGGPRFVPAPVPTPEEAA